MIIYLYLLEMKKSNKKMTWGGSIFYNIGPPIITPLQSLRFGAICFHDYLPIFEPQKKTRSFKKRLLMER